ncbi:hypothetical protein PHJA_002555200 [Phtheirospermum japonicum]|uniref:Uncharacterized protein n=1 Tax=Phtheirospermum japonicum TaxID=374723 RepID=A0A830D0H9_9LAMI|nr:hypothetical protein PHJA_002555200 [Phtheirospermum japonicum]
MAESKRNQETMKVTMKMGGGGIGAVVLLGGALATAALASAFVVGRNGRSSGHKSPAAREINKQKEEADESDKAQEFNVVDQPLNENKNPSSGEIKEVESDSDTAFLVSNQESTLDASLKVEEINDETPDNVCDIETNEQIICSISPKKLETDAISDGSVVIEENFALLDEKLQYEPQIMMHEDEVTMELTKDKDDNEIPKESQDPDEQVLIEDEERTESEPTDDYYDGEVKETSCHEAVEVTEKQAKEEETKEVCYDEEEIKVILEDNNEVEKKSELDIEKRELEERHVIDNGEMIFSESDSEDGQKAIQPVLESHVIERENVNGDEKKEIVEIIKENEFIEGSGEEDDDQMKHVEEKSAKEEECDQSDELIIVEKREDPIEVKEDIIPYSMLKEELISQSLEFVVDQEKQDENDDVERNMVVEEIKGSFETVTKENDETALSDDEVRLVDQEMGGKIQEDKAVGHDYKDSSFEHHQERPESDFGNDKLNSEKTTFTIKKYAGELASSSSSRRMMVAILSVMSSLSCSWFFGLSSVELCIIVCLTMVLSSSVVATV